MPKVLRDAATDLYPVPAVVVSCADKQGKANLITVAWVGVVCSDPPMVGLAVRPGRYSHPLIKQSREFVLNLPRADQAKVVDICGNVSGRSVDKFEATGLTAESATYVSAPLIKEFPVNIECRVRETLSLGTHDLFLAEIVAVHADQEVLDGTGDFVLEKLEPLAFVDGHYYALGRVMGHHGFSRKG